LLRAIRISGGRIFTIAGGSQSGDGGDGGLASDAVFSSIGGLAFSNCSSKLYLADSNNNVIRRFEMDFSKPRPAGGVIGTAVGQREAGYSGDGGPVRRAQLNNPQGLSMDPNHNLFIADTGNNVIRYTYSIPRPGAAPTPDCGDNIQIMTVAGVGGIGPGYGGDGGPATSARLSLPQAVAVGAESEVSNRQFYIADTVNGRVRWVNKRGVISTVAGSGGQRGQ
jgi:hypothetical protein